MFSQKREHLLLEKVELFWEKNSIFQGILTVACENTVDHLFKTKFSFMAK